MWAGLSGNFWHEQTGEVQQRPHIQVDNNPKAFTEQVEQVAQLREADNDATLRSYLTNFTKKLHQSYRATMGELSRNHTDQKVLHAISWERVQKLRVEYGTTIGKLTWFHRMSQASSNTRRYLLCQA